MFKSQKYRFHGNREVFLRRFSYVFFVMDKHNMLDFDIVVLFQGTIIVSFGFKTIFCSNLFPEINSL